MKDEREQANTQVCEACGTGVPSYDVVSCGSIQHGYRELCNRCFDADVALHETLGFLIILRIRCT